MTDGSVFRAGLLNEQVGIITGGGTGIGFGIAELLGALGMHVVLASRTTEHLRPAVEALAEREIAASAVVVDVRDHDSVQRMVRDVQASHGRIDLLVNNAAGNFYAPSESLSPNAWHAVLEIDLTGTFFCSQAVLPVMRHQGGGRIVNISMTLHYRGWPQMAHATAAKAGIDALTRTLALEWAPHGVRVNAVAPGPVPTEGVKRAFVPADPATPPLFSRAGATADAPPRGIPLGRWGSPRDIANAVVFLASPAGDWITGTIVVVDGGEWLSKTNA
ncbi:MAG TPA: SDR family oxidoreductase [Gemmatimonadaceae bacterium]|nr:SDR family oxidoreductase [Gemmatimonadaceae bacterium]